MKQISVSMERQSKKLKVDSSEENNVTECGEGSSSLCCKNWQSSYSSSCEPWFLLYGEGSQCSLLINNDQHKKFSMEIPELDGATCLASKDGWLLLFNQGSVFFLNPFSRAKIDLPKIPFSELSDDSEYIAAFSCAPTSKENCTVAVIKRWEYIGIQLYLHNCQGGGDNWAEHEHICTLADLSTIRVAVYEEGVFHIFDGFYGSVTFDARTEKWRTRIEFSSMKKLDSGGRNCKISRKWFWTSNLREKLGLEGDFSVSICGTLIPHSDDEVDLLIQNENLEGSQGSKGRHVKGVWIQPPRLFQLPADERLVA